MMSTRTATKERKQALASVESTEEVIEKQPKRGTIYCIFNTKSFIVSRSFEKFEEVNKFKDMLGEMSGSTESLTVKEFSCIEDFELFKEASKMNKEVTPAVISPPVKEIHNPYKKAAVSYSSVSTKLGDSFLKSHTEGLNNLSNDKTDEFNYTGNPMLATFSENLKKVLLS